MSVQFVVDKEGHKTGVFMSFEEYVELLELAEDAEAVAALKNLKNKTLEFDSLEDVLADLEHV